MKTKLERFQARQFSAVALGIGSALSLAASGSAGIPAGAPEDSAHTTETCIPWPQIGARAGANYQGDGLALIPAVDGARLRCIFQRLEGEATGEGLWITSTVEGRQSCRFRVIAHAVGREEDALGVPA